MKKQKRNWQKFRKDYQKLSGEKEILQGLRTDTIDFYAYWGKIW